ncbi:MAG TPA: hypothetical protein VF631_09675 [Allosphingosinicella sp.]|uniref:hypothetical protein n=1 Tax=Allosphingosinicella sp. TaxID=2823234 RepID=UPI002F287301
MHDLASARAAHLRVAHDWPRSWWLVLAALCFGAIAAFRVLVAVWPSLGDAALFMYFGQRMNEGARLYVDVWDLKPPIIFLVNAAADRLGDQRAWLALFETAALAGAGWLLWSTLHRARSWPPATAAALLFYTVLVGYDAIAEGGNYSELYVLPLAALSKFLFVRALDEHQPALLAGAGAAACLAAFAKLPGLAPLLAQIGLLLSLLLVPGRRSQAAAALSWCLAGFGLCLAILLGLGAWLSDLKALIDGSLLHPIHYAGGHLPGSGHALTDQFYVLIAIAMPLALAACAAVAGAFGLLQAAKGKPKSDSGLLLPGLEAQQLCGLFALWALADLAGALGTGRNYGHYFLPFALSGAAASAMLISLVRDRGGYRPGQAVLSLFAVALCVNAANAGRMSWWRISSRAPGVEAAVPPSQRAILAELRARARPEDRLAVWDSMFALYPMSGVRNALPYPTLTHGIDSDHALRNEAPAMLDALRRCLPTFLVLSRPSTLTDARAVRFEASVRALATSRYDRVRLDAGAGEAQLWMRRGPGPLSCRNI